MIGLFFFGMGATLVGGLIAWYIINNYVIDKDEDQILYMVDGCGRFHKRVGLERTRQDTKIETTKIEKRKV